MVATPEAVYAGGNFTKISGQPHRYFAVFPIQTAFESAPEITRLNSQGEFESTLRVGDGRSVVIQASYDLVQWEDVLTTLPAGSSIRFTDPAGPGQRFYRAVLEP